jgi:hypothetical protein
MADSDELLQAIELEAREFAPREAERFSDAARQDLAEWRELRTGKRLEVRIPDRYRGMEEEYVVFDAFVRTFIEPIALSSSIASTLRELRWLDVRTVSFELFGESRTPSGQVSAEDADRLGGDVRHLEEVAIALGRDVFGDRFRPHDFWGAPAA